MSVVVISPHRDDAVVSCGLLILDLVRCRVPVQIINCFTISDYAPNRKDARDVTALRREEDERVAAVLGNSVAWLDLALLDAPLRLGVSSDVVCGLPPRSNDISELAARLEAATGPDACVLAPLALGDHVDHVVARRAAEKIAHAYYEDLPYAEETHAHRVATYVTPVDRLDEKLALVRFYESQFAPHEFTAIERHGAEGLHIRADRCDHRYFVRGPKGL